MLCYNFILYSRLESEATANSNKKKLHETNLVGY